MSPTAYHDADEVLDRPPLQWADVDLYRCIGVCGMLVYLVCIWCIIVSIFVIHVTYQHQRARHGTCEAEVQAEP
jgi:hypothetical protein